MTAKYAKALPFALDPSTTLTGALTMVAQRLGEQDVDTTAANLHAAGINIHALSQRVEQSDDFSLPALMRLLDIGVGVRTINALLESETPTGDIDLTVLMPAKYRAFVFDPSLAIDEALATIDSRLTDQHVGDVNAAELQASGVNVLALSQRVREADDFDAAAVAILVNTGWTPGQVNEVLEGETPTNDVDTGFYWLADDRELALRVA